MVEPTTRAYTLKLSGKDDWRALLWKTHVTVNRGALAWGDWLLNLRGGLPPRLADDHPERQVLLALSWLSVESPVSLVPRQHIVATGKDSENNRRQKIEQRFREILARLKVNDPNDWMDVCVPALTARIRDDAVWVDRSKCFEEFQKAYPGLTSEWAANTLFDFFSGAEDYFVMPDTEAIAPTDSKDFVQKAGGWLSRNWGAGEKSDSVAIGTCLAELSGTDASLILNKPGAAALATLLESLGQAREADTDAIAIFKQLKQTIGWKGRPSKGAIALEKIRDADSVSAEQWQQTVTKLREESSDQSSKGTNSTGRPQWMETWRIHIESQLGMPYRTDKDLIWEHGVALDHALRRVSAAHTWIKRAEVARRRFQEDARKIAAIPPVAREWLDAFCESRSTATGAVEDYFIRKRAVDGWEKVAQAWSRLGPRSTRIQRIEAARELQANLDENEKFGDIQLFAGFGDEDDDLPQPCLADDTAFTIWHDDTGRANADILKNYVDATTADRDQRRFKVPAYRHPDPLRHPIYVDFGKSRWRVDYSVLEAHHDRAKWREQLVIAKTDKARSKLRERLATSADLRTVSLDVWNGSTVEPLPLRWHGKRLWKDIDLQNFGASDGASIVSRADRFGRIVAKQPRKNAVNIAEIFGQKDWNGRLQIPREQLDRLADLVYGKTNGKRNEPDFDKVDRLNDNPRAQKFLRCFNWFLTTSAKLQPQGPWLDYVDLGLPEGMEFKKGRNGYFLNYAANKDRKGRARLQLARLPGLRILSFDLGHRYAAACAIWETITEEKLKEEVRGHKIVAGNIGQKCLYLHTQHAGSDGKPRKTIYRRTGPDMWARLERQFLVKLQGEDRPARLATSEEIRGANKFREFLGLPSLTETPHIDDLHRDTVRIARLGLRRLGDVARIAYIITATKKPTAGGKERELNHEQRIEYLQDAILAWRDLAKSTQYPDTWTSEKWESWVRPHLTDGQAIEIPDDLPRSERKKRIDTARAALRAFAERLADPKSENATQLNRIWSEEWRHRKTQWQKHLRWLRNFVLPRSAHHKKDANLVRRLGGLSVKRLQTIRDLYQTLKAFHMRPEPDNLRKNIPELWDESLTNFGRRILNQLQRLREQRIKQLASRIVEAGLGAGRMPKSQGRDRKRPDSSTDRPCHAVVAENLEHYRPEDSRLRRENRQLMNWAARNVRNYIVEGCQLYGLHFVEVSPGYTSRQDSRTGAPGIRCEDIPRQALQEAARRAVEKPEANGPPASARTESEREVQRWVRELRRINERVKQGGEISARDKVLAAASQKIASLPKSRSAVRLPRRGGEIFVSALVSSSVKVGLQADLNAAANIGLKAIIDPDWPAAWWFVLVNLSSGAPVAEKVEGCPVWPPEKSIWAPADDAASSKPSDSASKKQRRSKQPKTSVYAWNPLHGGSTSDGKWLATIPHWSNVERTLADRLILHQTEIETPF